MMILSATPRGVLAALMKIVIAAAIPAIFPASALCAETHGLFSVEDFYSKDSSAIYDRHLLTTRLRLDVLKLGNSGKTGLHFDGRERLNLGPEDYADSTASARIDVMNADYDGQTLYLSAGRLWPRELPIERVDGVNAVIKKDAHGFGFFGGFNPNPYTEAFTSEFTAAGAYYFYQKDGLGGRLAFAHKGFRGRTDRQYVYGEFSYFPANGLSVYSSATVDINQGSLGAKLTNGLVELTYRPDYVKSVTVGYNQFRAFRLYESMDYEIDDSRQEAYYISGNYRLLDKYTVYGRVERQSRHYPDLDASLENAMIYGMGVNAGNIFGTGVNMDMNATVSDSYGSLHNTYSIQFDRLNWEVLQLIVHASYSQNEYGTADDDDIWAFGAAGYLYLFRNWNFSVAYDMEHGNFYDTQRVLTRAAYKY